MFALIGSAATTHISIYSYYRLAVTSRVLVGVLSGSNRRRQHNTTQHNMAGVLLASLICCVAGVSVVWAKSLEMPPYLTACNYNDPDLNACALRSARIAFPQFVNGDKKYRVPNMRPLEVTELRVNEGVLGLNLTARNIKFYGMDQAQVNLVNIDLEKRTARYQITIPRAEVLCDYEIEGKILILPITGAGPGNITLLNLNVTYSYMYDLAKRKDGQTYGTPRDGVLKLDMSRLHVKLENLFNGNKLLGDQMNVFMEENWRELVTDIGPVIGEAIAATTQQILSSIFNLVSMEKAFPGYPG